MQSAKYIPEDDSSLEDDINLNWRDDVRKLFLSDMNGAASMCLLSFGKILLKLHYE